MLPQERSDSHGTTDHGRPPMLMSSAAILVVLQALAVAGAPTDSRPDNGDPPPAALAMRSSVSAATGAPVAQSLHYQFRRASTAYFGSRLDMREYGSDTPVWQTVVASTLSDGVYAHGEALNGADLYPFCRNSRYMFGYGDDERIYRTTDGTTWESLGAYPATMILALSDDALVRTWVRSDGRLAVARSPDDGQSWQASHWADTGEEFAWLTPEAFLHLTGWGFHQAGNGTIVMVEYKPIGGRYIYRSGDSGRTWSVVDDNGGMVKHYHAVGKQEQLNRWVAVTGDGSTQQKLVVSDDDALTWSDYTFPGERRLQPIYLMDYGHPTRLLFGSDTDWQVGWVDVSDGPDAKKIASVITNWNHALSRDFCSQIFRHNGVYYASTWDYQPAPRNVVISISEDLEHWAIYHRFTADEVGVYGFAGEAGGKLHLKVHTGSAYKHMVISPARVALRDGLIVSPGATNLFTNSSLSSAETTDGWINASQEIPAGSGLKGLFQSTSDTAHHGTTSLHYARSDGGAMTLLSPSIPFEPGRTYQARFWIKGLGDRAMVGWSQNGVAVGDWLALGLPQDEWREMITQPWTPVVGANDLRVLISLFSTTDYSCTAYIDSLQVEEAPSTHWQLGGTPRAETALEAVVLPTNGWTNVFTIEPDSFSEYLVQTGELHIKTYWLRPDTYAELVFDPGDLRFKLWPTVNGITLEPIATSPQHFQRRAQVRLGVRCDDQHVGLSISNGQPIESATAQSAIGLTSGRLSIRCDSELHKSLPFALFNDVMYDGYVADSLLADAMNDVTTPCFADANRDSKLDLVDLSMFTSCMYGPEADFNLGHACLLDDDDDGHDVDLADFAAFQRNFGADTPCRR